MFESIILLTVPAVVLLLAIFILFQLKNSLRSQQQVMQEQLFNTRERIQEQMGQFSQTLEQRFGEQGQQAEKRQFESLKTLQDSLRIGLQDMGKQVDKLTITTEQRLQDIAGQVDKRLSAGFEKTSETFTNIIKRLALIDDAQKKLTELSSNVVSLQDILTDKRSRGAFGEVQLNSLIQNVLPSSHYRLQHSFSNGVRADCVLFLPEPTGTIAIDAKFPLENYQRLTNFQATDSERKQSQTAFKQDIKKHINDIANKYIIKNETADGAIMFIPAEAVFAEIHAQFPELVTFSQQQRVWLASPTTMMAILTTAAGVLKDDARRKHVHIIQEHLHALAVDFSRFEDRMEKLSRHIDQAQADVQQVNKSAKKISSRFRKIEQVELEHETQEQTPAEIDT